MHFEDFFLLAQHSFLGNEVSLIFILCSNLLWWLVGQGSPWSAGHTWVWSADLPKKSGKVGYGKKLCFSRWGFSWRWEVGENMNLEWFLSLWLHQLLCLGAFFASGTVHYFFVKTLGWLNTGVWISLFYLDAQTFITSKDNPLSVPGVCVGCWSLGLKTAKVLKCFW